MKADDGVLTGLKVVRLPKAGALSNPTSIL